jgi:hypothetical protein
MLASINPFLSVVFLNSQLDGVGDLVFKFLGVLESLSFYYKVSMLIR